MPQTLRLIPAQPTWVHGEMRPGQGWSVSQPGAPGAREVSLRIEIQDADGGFLLLVRSADGSVFADQWHLSLSDAEAAAREQYGADWPAE